MRPLSGLGDTSSLWAKLADGSVLTVDPSLNIVLPFGPDKFGSEANAIFEAYRRVGKEQVGATMIQNGNFVARNAGDLSYSAAAGWKSRRSGGLNMPAIGLCG